MREQTLRYLSAFSPTSSLKQNNDSNNNGTSSKIRFDKIFSLSKAILVTGSRTSKLTHFLDNRLTDGDVVLSLTLLCKLLLGHFVLEKLKIKWPFGEILWHTGK
jgi:hypothetical protein